MKRIISLTKKAIPLVIKDRIKQIVTYSKTKNIYLQYNANTKKIYLIGTPEHDNLGDHAIVYATQKYLNDILPEYEFIEIPINIFNSHLLCLKKFITSNDLIVLHGGGNFGNEYMFEENIRRTVIKSFPNHPLLLFPQTIYFKDDERGRKELEISKRIYTNHRNLTLVAREKISFEVMKREFPKNNVILTPDIVMYLNKTKPAFTRNGALLCLRNDKEGVISQEKKERMYECCNKYHTKIKITDTCTQYSISIMEREKELTKILEEFKQVELVITDRLHGMIFASITSTPCIALGNYNQKVQGTYEWLHYLDHIRYINSVDELEENIILLKGIRTSEYNSTFALPYYEDIANVLI